MIYGLYQSAAGMMVNEYRQGVLANNLANAETSGFKRDVATFSERRTAADVGQRRGPTHDLMQQLTGGIWLGKTQTDFGEGVLQRTELATDIALAGPGFFQVRDAQGTDLLTRDGRLLMDSEGRLVSATDGAAVLGRGGAPILLNPRGGELTIDDEGRVSQDGQIAAQLAVVDVTDYDALQKVGASRFRGGELLATPRPEARVMQGFVESSGVEPVKEMVSMLEASRAYQLNAQMITMQDQSLGRLIGSIANL